MTAVFVHGVPETAAPLGRRPPSPPARDDTIAVSLPGFGHARPAGFGATKDEYVDWLVGELERVVADAGGPVDLVGHDWGGGFVVRVVSTRSDLVRTWVTDAAGVADVDFEWHDFAKIWQTPGDGEAFWQQQLAASARRSGGDLHHVRRARGRGQGHGRPRRPGDGRLHPGAVPLGHQGARRVGPGVRGHRPAAASWWCRPVTRSCPPTALGGSASRAGARIEALAGKGHWWMLQDPAAAAALLSAFWSAD